MLSASEDVLIHLIRTVSFYEKQNAELRQQLSEAQKKIAEYESREAQPKLSKLGEVNVAETSLTN